MSQSLVKNTVHLVFSTKHRTPLIKSPIEAELHSYLFGTCKQIDCTPIRVGGASDHVHVLCALSKKLPLMKLLEVLKSHSSRWIKTKGNLYQGFYWQDGYAAFSVSPRDIDRVVSYIDNQKEHHRQKTFQEELRTLLMEHQLDFDERYLWD
jgi:putative transposase